MSMLKTVPCGIHTVIKFTKGTSVACSGTCAMVSVTPGERGGMIVRYRCDRCGHTTSRYADGSPLLPAWDGMLRDGTPYAESGADENDWRL
jgi:hypothetical protein